MGGWTTRAMWKSVWNEGHDERDGDGREAVSMADVRVVEGIGEMQGCVRKRELKRNVNQIWRQLGTFRYSTVLPSCHVAHGW